MGGKNPLIACPCVMYLVKLKQKSKMRALRYKTLNKRENKQLIPFPPKQDPRQPEIKSLFQDQQQTEAKTQVLQLHYAVA